MTIYNGWTKELSREEREANRAAALAAIEADRKASEDAQVDELAAEFEAAAYREMGESIAAYFDQREAAEADYETFIDQAAEWRAEAYNEAERGAYPWTQADRD